MNKSQADRIQAQDSRVAWQNCVAPHLADFLPSNQPLNKLDPLRDAHAQYPRCRDMASHPPSDFATYYQV